MEGRRGKVGMRGKEVKERRDSGGGATRDLRDQVVDCTAERFIVESSNEGGSRKDGDDGVGKSVVGVLGGVRDEARPSNWREM
jgi:hypothetical protein